MTPPILGAGMPLRDERRIPFADDRRAMEAADRQMSRWNNLLERLATE